jgi:Fe-S cluster assembly protein SufB
MSESSVIDERVNSDYGAGFITDVEMQTFDPGLDENVIRSNTWIS